jgi:hypothetical protein
MKERTGLSNVELILSHIYRFFCCMVTIGVFGEEIDRTNDEAWIEGTVVGSST